MMNKKNAGSYLTLFADELDTVASASTLFTDALNLQFHVLRVFCKHTAKTVSGTTLFADALRHCEIRIYADSKYKQTHNKITAESVSKVFTHAPKPYRIGIYTICRCTQILQNRYLSVTLLFADALRYCRIGIYTCRCTQTLQYRYLSVSILFAKAPRHCRIDNYFLCRCTLTLQICIYAVCRSTYALKHRKICIYAVCRCTQTKQIGIFLFTDLHCLQMHSNIAESVYILFADTLRHYQICIYKICSCAQILHNRYLHCLQMHSDTIELVLTLLADALRMNIYGVCRCTHTLQYCYLHYSKMHSDTAESVCTLFADLNCWT